MKFKKRILIFWLSTMFIVSLVTPIYATQSVDLMVGSYTAVPGETVSVPISITHNSGFVSMSLSVIYDESAVTLISCEDTGLLDVGEHSHMHSPHFTSPYVLTWENDILTSNITSTGTIAYLTFLVSEDAKEQNYSIIVRIPADGILDANGNSVSASSAMGTITVSKQHECSFGDWEYYGKTKHVRYCDGCDEKEYKNHNWNDGEIIEAPTHDAEGEIKYTCDDCGATKTTEIDPEGHDWGDWAKLSDTQHKRTCSCGGEETETHNWNAGVVTKEPTATEAGIRTYTCNDCSATKTESISPNTIVVTGVSLNKTSETLKIGDSVSLIATITPSDATNKNVVWSSLDSSIASVVNGVVTANKAGTTTITVTTVDGGFTATCVVVVENDPVGEKTIVGYKWYSGALRHKVIYSDGTYDMEDCASADCVCGRIYENIPEHVPGDIDGDGFLKDEDITLFMQYNAGWDVKVNKHALDINGDGSVNNKDVTRLMQYYAGWKVEIN